MRVIDSKWSKCIRCESILVLSICGLCFDYIETVKNEVALRWHTMRWTQLRHVMFIRESIFVKKQKKIIVELKQMDDKTMVDKKKSIENIGGTSSAMFVRYCCCFVALTNLIQFFTKLPCIRFTQKCYATRTNSVHTFE